MAGIAPDVHKNTGAYTGPVPEVCQLDRVTTISYPTVARRLTNE
jgi:hypothetical protein